MKDKYQEKGHKVIDMALILNLKYIFIHFCYIKLLKKYIHTYILEYTSFNLKLKQLEFFFQTINNTCTLIYV